jgi:hypothetical protein
VCLEYADKLIELGYRHMQAYGHTEDKMDLWKIQILPWEGQNRCITMCSKQGMFLSKLGIRPRDIFQFLAANIHLIFDSCFEFFTRKGVCN